MSESTTGSGRESAPILEKIIRKLPPGADRDECVARKYNCASVWCPVCYKRFHLQRHFARLSEMPWKESRLVTLTLDREKVGSGADAYIWFREKKALGRFFVSLERQGVEVKDWAGQIEWHNDGTPHWHLLIRTKPGKAGMIGQDQLHKAWPWGRMLKEDYFKNKAHYDNTVGYFGKCGYFHKGKKHQTELPDYFKSDYFKGKRIARFYSARRPSGDRQEQNPPKSDPEPSDTVTGRKLATCGQSTLLWYWDRDVDECGFPVADLRFLERSLTPFADFVKGCPGKFEQGIGYTFWPSGAPPDHGPCPF